MAPLMQRHITNKPKHKNDKPNNHIKVEHSSVDNTVKIRVGMVTRKTTTLGTLTCSNHSCRDIKDSIQQVKPGHTMVQRIRCLKQTVAVQSVQAAIPVSHPFLIEIVADLGGKNNMAIDQDPVQNGHIQVCHLIFVTAVVTWRITQDTLALPTPKLATAVAKQVM